MASTVTVFETSARRTVVKVTPAKYLHEIRAEACAKFKLSPDKYGLKHNTKTLDLSTPFRHTGLAAGARLELTLLSRSASVVTVALQLPESEAAGATNGRLVDKFSSTTTLWQILRKFEDGVAGTDTKRNLTARGVPLTSNGDSGGGRLYYEQPVLVIMHKELSSFVDLQKTLSTLGLSSGNVLIKLAFKSSEQPFEEAQEQIGQYFQEVEGHQRELEDSQKEGTGEDTDAVGKQDDTLVASSQSEITADQGGLQKARDTKLSTTDGVHVPDAPAAGHPTLTSQAGNLPEPIQSITDRPTTIFAAPSNSRPQAATTTHNEADYEYTVEHAQIQNAQYKTAGRNRTLPSDAEVDAKRKEAAERVAAVQSVKIRTRFPDNTQSVAEFNQKDTGKDLYSHVRKILTHEEAPFTLRYRGPKGMSDVPSDSKKLIRDAGLTGDATVFLTWQDGAGVNVRKDPALKSQVTANAKEIEVPVIADQPGQGTSSGSTGPSKADRSEKKTGGMPAWLKKTLPGGKK